MSVPQSVATILRDHVTLEVECLDRLYLNVYVPTLRAIASIAPRPFNVTSKALTPRPIAITRTTRIASGMAGFADG